jgi:cytochrome c oxidase cbb3-type subunit III
MNDQPNQPDAPLDGKLRPHTFDGIQEYDMKLPRWWLLTLYGAMVFAAVYWGYYHAYSIGTPPALALEKEMAENATAAAQKSGVIDDNTLWKMSHDTQVLSAAKVTFDTTCAVCHKPDMTGLIGPNLVDKEWIHGGNPMDAFKTINEGVLVKGMPAWGPMLGRQKMAELVAYIFAHHHPGEEVKIVPGWTPPPGVVPIPPPPPAQ